MGNLVLGAGLAGLTTAIDLGKMGKDVTVLEKESVVGGHACSHRLPNGYVHDMGLHVIIPDAFPLYEMVKAAGIESNLVRFDMRFGFLENGRVHSFSPNPLSAARFRLLGIRDKIRLRKLMTGTDDRDQDLSNVTAEEFVTNNVSRKALDSFLEPLLTRLSGLPPEELSAAFFVAFIRLLGQVKNFQFCYPKTGFGELPEGMAAHARSLGADIHTGASVEEIRTDKESVRSAVYLEDGKRKEIDATNVVSTLPFKDLRRIAPLPREYNDKLAGIHYAEYLIAYFGLEGRLSRYEMEVMVPRKEGFSFNSFVEVTNITKDVAPAGKSLFSVVATQRAFGKRTDEEVLDTITQDLNQIFPEFEEKVGWRRLIRHPVATVNKDYMSLKPGFVTPIKGLYLAGAQMFPLQDMVSAIVSGHTVSDLVMGTPQ